MIDIRVSDLLEAARSVIESANVDPAVSLDFFARLRYWLCNVIHLS